MHADPLRFSGAFPLGRWSGWVGTAAFAVFVATGVASRAGGSPATAAVGAAIALSAGLVMFLGPPRLTLTGAAAATVGVALLGNAVPSSICWFALNVVAAWCILCRGPKAGGAYAAACVALFGGEWVWAVRDPGWGAWTAGLVATVGATVLIRHQLVLVSRLRAAQADLAERSAAEERNRIARELHDVIAHCLTVSLLHVSAARLAVEHDPADAARALAEAERLGRQSLAEVRATMGLLRSNPSQAFASPVPGVDQIPRLVDEVRAVGADISLTIDGDLAQLPATVGSTAFRITQEALTNATKHAPGRPVRICLTSSALTLEVCVDSGGPPGDGSGLGLQNMRERARAVGGTCKAGPGGAGWLVTASLPNTPFEDQNHR